MCLSLLCVFCVFFSMDIGGLIQIKKKKEKVLLNIGLDWSDRKLIWNLQNIQVAYVRIGDGLSTACTIGKARMFTISIVVFNL